MGAELKDVNPTTLDGDSVYDFDLHMPLPTISYILQETGIDLVLATGSTTQANTTIRFMTKTAMNAIKANLPSMARINVEYLIAKSEKYRVAFLDVVAYMILAVKGNGIDDLLQAGKTQLDTLTRLAQLQAQANDLMQHRYGFVVDEIRGNY